MKTKSGRKAKYREELNSHLLERKKLQFKRNKTSDRNYQKEIGFSSKVISIAVSERKSFPIGFKRRLSAGIRTNFRLIRRKKTR